MAPTQFIDEVRQDCVKFTINGEKYSVDSSVHPSTSLLSFVREVARLSGTKGNCYEGGCGLCTLVATKVDKETEKLKTFSLRSCQTLVYSCAGMAIETIEYLGNKNDGYGRIQTALKGFYGTQCGFCTPGFVMAMHGEKESSDNLKVKDVETALDGNLCRCTGYRPILDAFKSFATDAPKNLSEKLTDIEDAYKKNCSRTGTTCEKKCAKSCKETSFEPQNTISCDSYGVQWIRPLNVQGVYDVLNTSTLDRKVRIVVGNTGQGVFKRDGPFGVYLDTSGIKEFYEVDINKGVFGANVSLTRCIEAFEEMSKLEGYAHMERVAKHWRIIASAGIRNTGCWAGNLQMKHDHPDFPSDVFLTLAAVDVVLTLGKPDSSQSWLMSKKETNVEHVQWTVSVEEFLTLDTKKTLILSMRIPKQDQNIRFRSFKITPRAVNAHAHLNAAFKIPVDSKDKFRVTSKPTIIYGGVNSSFVHASKTESLLVGLSLMDSRSLSSVMVSLKNELIHMDKSELEASPEYRLELAKSLFYKTILEILGDASNSEVRSGASDLERPISSGVQEYDANEDSWPVGKAMPKLESDYQVAGEAEYVDDLKKLPDEHFGIFVQSQFAKAKIEKICTKACQNIDGFVDFVCAADIPGENSFTYQAGPVYDPVFAEKKVAYAGQAVGLVVAKTKSAALRAAKLVKVVYTDIEKPILEIKDAIKAGQVEKATNFKTFTTDDIVVGDVEEAYKKCDNISEGTLEQGTQFHFPMEPHSARVIPVEDGFDVNVTTQWPTEAQNTVARCLKIDANSVNVSLRRLGGAFGSKISRGHIVSCAAALAAQKIRKPVRVTLDLATHMTLVGWREPFYSTYKVGYSNKGHLEAVSVDVYSDYGHIRNEGSVGIAAIVVPNAYHSPNWLIRPFSVVTDTAANTYCRTPGHVEGMATIEHILDHIAHKLKMDPLEIREKNMISSNKPHGILSLYGPNLVESAILPLMKKKADLMERKTAVGQFNKDNRWKKRGLAVMPMYYNFTYIPVFKYNVQVVIYESDGTVGIVHAGVEMGQGINTKIAQVAAKVLDISMELIKIKPNNDFVNANSSVTGGANGTDLNAHAVKVSCERLRARMNVVAEKMKSETGIEPVWKDLVAKCAEKQVDMSERFQLFPREHPKSYDIWAVSCTEVEIDVLTGQFLILRSDIIEDCGKSLSPYIDIGQVEGAFVMGLGFYTSERVKFDLESGKKLSVGTWDYKPPTALDIPVDFRVSFLPKGDNKFGVVGSKATGEPALCLSYNVIMALRQAIFSARKDAGHMDWIDMDTPFTVEKIRQYCNVISSQFTI